MLGYTIKDRRAEARTAEGYNQAKADKQQDPSLPFEVVAWYGRGGICMGSLIWTNGRWA